MGSQQHTPYVEMALNKIAPFNVLFRDKYLLIHWTLVFSAGQ